MPGGPFKPGDPRINRKGRPKKGQTFTDVLEKVLKEKTVDYNGKKISGKEAAARKLLQLAISGDVTALKYLADRIDGSPRGLTALVGAQDQPPVNVNANFDFGKLTDDELDSLEQTLEKIIKND